MATTKQGNQFSKRIGAAIADQRLRKGLTQEQVAEAIGVEQETISRFERGATLPPLGRLIDLADLLGVPLESLVRTSSPRVIDQAADIAALLEPLSEENREWVQALLAQLCRKLSAEPAQPGR